MKIRSTPKEILKSVFGYDSFRPLQEDIIDNLLGGRDTLVVFATSGGKSLCYQVPALCAEGTAIVISPLISLMKDQVDTLVGKGVSAAYVNSTMSFDEAQETLRRFAAGEYKLFYVAPERLTDSFLEMLSRVNVSFVAIDEAHCVSMYGNDFRPSYTQIGPFFDKLSKHRGARRVPRIALTATAPESVREEICSLLTMDNHESFIGGFQRDNIDFSVIQTEDKNGMVDEVVRHYGHEPMIIYCTTVKSVEAQYNRLKADGINVGAYHGKLSPDSKKLIQEAFLSGRVNVMVATCAFGMGVDKSDVRTVLHYQMPSDLEAYYQEAGRAGRDGEHSRAFMLYSDADRQIPDFFIANTYPSDEEIQNVYQTLSGLSSMMPLDCRLDYLNDIIPGKTDPLKTASIIRLLGERKVIDVLRQTETDIILDLREDVPVDALDFTDIQVRRKIAVRSLQSMIKYAKTPDCRQRHVMKHFGQRTEEDCGHCDNCLSRKYFLDKGAYIPEAFVLSALSGVKACGKKSKMGFVLKYLLGVADESIDKTESARAYGSFANWSQNGVRDLLNSLVRGEMLFELQTGELVLTKRGEDVLSQTAPARVKLNFSKSNLVTREMFESELVSKSNFKRALKVEDTTIDYALVNTLKKGRDFLSKRFCIQPIALMSEDMLVQISKKRPTTTDELYELGLPSEIDNEWPDQILAILEHCYSKHKDVISK